MGEGESMTDKIEDKVMALPEKLKNNDMAHELIELPREINEKHSKILELDGSIIGKKALIELEENKLKREVYKDVTLTNKDKRDLALAEKVQESVEIIDLRDEIKKLSGEKELNDIQLKYLYNKFTAIKYLIRLLETLSE